MKELKRRNMMPVGSLKDQFILAVLKLPVGDGFGSFKEIKSSLWIIKPSLE